MRFRLQMQVLSAILSILLLFSALGLHDTYAAASEGDAVAESTPSATALKSDITGHWAEGIMQKWIGLELLNGYAGKYKPGANISRAEFVTILSRIMNLPHASNGVSFEDVPESSWFYESVENAYYYGLVNGKSAKSFAPEAFITRQDAAVIVARAFQLSGAQEQAAAVKDRLQIADYALAAVDALFAKQYVKGRGDQNFAPLGLLTRAEAVQLIDRVMGTWVTDASELKSPIRGNLLVSKSDTKLQGLVIEGDLYIVQGVGEGGIQLDGITVKGNTYVLGGREAIELHDSTLTGPLIVNKKAGDVRLIASGGTTIPSVVMGSGGVLEEKGLKEGAPGFQTVTANSGKPSEHGKVVLIGVFDQVTGARADSELELAKGTVVDRFIVDAPVVVGGQGTVKLAIFQASGSVFGKWPEKVEFKPDVTATIESKLVDKDDRGSSGSGSTGGGNPEPEPGAGDIDYLVQSGAASADIVLPPLATEMERLAANELRDTLQMISGAEIPIYTRDYADGEISAQFMNSTLAVKKSGDYSVQITLLNRSEEAVVLDGVDTTEQGIAVTWPTEITLAAKEYKIVTGTVHIPEALQDGVYSLAIQFENGTSAVHGLPLQIKLQREYLSNGDFELHTTGLPYPDSWIFDSEAAVWDDQMSASGSHSIKLIPGSADWIFFRANHDIKPESGKQYVLSAQVKNNSHAGKAVMLIREVLKDGTDTWFSKELAASSNWNKQSLYYTPSANVRDIWVYFEISQQKDEPVWIDAVSLNEVAAPVNDNLLYNADFEQSSENQTAPDGWNWWGDDAVWDSNEQQSGSYSVRIGSKPSGWIWAVSTVKITVDPNKQYKLSAWLKNPGTTGQDHMMILEQLPGGGDNGIYINLPKTTEWTSIEHDYTPSPGITEVLIAFKADTLSDSPLWIDNASFHEVEDSAAPEEGEDDTPPQILFSGALQDLRLMIGTTASIPALSTLFPDDVANLQNSDGFAIRRIGDTVYIFGTEPKGALNGVYDFLEENAGILWTRSIDIGNLYEEQDTIELTKADYTEKSPFLLRGWHTTGTGTEGDVHADFDTEKMLARNKINAKFAELDFNRSTWPRQQQLGIQSYVLGHNLHYWLSPFNSIESLIQTHPQYFNLDANGEPYYGSNTQINFFHEDVANIVADNMAYFLSDNPVDYIGIGINDTRQFNQGELTNTPFEYAPGQFVDPSDPAFRSTVYFTFLNKVASKLKISNPGVKLTTFAYFFTEVPPKVTLEDNIHILYAPIDEDARTPMNTTDTNNPNFYYNELLNQWAEVTSNLSIYNYYGSFVNDAYERPIAEKVKVDLQYYRDLGVIGLLPEGIVDANGPQWGINALQFWLFDKLFWNPDEDLEQLKTEFIQKAYGNAAQAMRTYYDLIEEGWNYDQMPIHFSTGKKTLVRQYIINPGIKDAAQAALDTAYALADAKQKERIAPIKTAFEELTAIVEGITETTGMAVKTSATKEEILNTLDFSQGPWTDAIPLTNFLVMNKMQPVPVETKVRLLWDDENIYIGYENFDFDLSKRTISESAPNEWWASGFDDSVETYLTGDMTGTQKFFAYFTNPLSINLEFAGLPVDTSYKAAWSGKAETKQDRWNVVQAIPFASFGVDSKATSQIKAHFMRNYHMLDGGDYHSWTGGAVWNPRDLSIIHLVDPKKP